MRSRRVLRRGPPPAPLVPLGLPHPVPQRLRRAADLLGDRHDTPPSTLEPSAVLAACLAVDASLSASPADIVHPRISSFSRNRERRKTSGSLDLIIPERFRTRHWDGYRQVMATGVTGYGQRLLAVRAMRKDGQRISIEFSIALLKDERGEVAGAVVRDVTARWQAEHGRAAAT